MAFGDPVPAVAELSTLLGARLVTSHAVREQHGADIMHPAVRSPDAVAYPRSTDDVATIVRICSRYRVPVIPFGAGTSVEGHVTTPYGGISVDVSEMTRVVAVNERDMDATVEAGVTREGMNTHLRATGLFFPVDPGANATLGGMAATRASGTTTVRYGAMRENVMGLTIVLADGTVLRTGSRARKSAAGYDLTRMLVGSEGTLGLITEVTLRLHPIPEAMAAAVCAFDTLENAANTAIEIIQSGIPVARIELLDALSIHALNRHAHLNMHEGPTLFLEFHGSENSVSEQSDIARQIAQNNSGKDFVWATRPEERNALWKARHEAALASLALKPGAKAIPTDVCVPISRLAQCIAETQTDLKAANICAPIGGHVGDGNFHVMLLVDRENTTEYVAAQRAHDRLVHRALAMGGTCTGEHGVGVGKIPYLREEAGESGIALMQRLKSAFDPAGIMNPGKIFQN